MFLPFRKFAAIVLLPLFISGCKKKEYTCSYDIDYLRPGLSFVGFTTPEINRMVVSKYTANSGFSTLLSRDTINVIHPVFMGDTAYAKGSGYDNDGFITPEIGFDYTIESLSTQQIFTITHVEAGDETKTWMQETPCSPGASQIRISTFSLNINGAAAIPYTVHTNSFLYCLVR